MYAALFGALIRFLKQMEKLGPWPKLERYGAAHIVNTETVFWKDSECFMRAIKELKIHQDDQKRQFLGVLNVLDWCSFLDNDLYRPQDFVKKCLNVLSRKNLLIL